MHRGFRIPSLALALGVALCACGGGDEAAPPAANPDVAPAAPAAAATAPAAGPDLPKGLVLALAQFVEQDGKPVPGAARLEFLAYRDGKWQMTALEDPESNVFHKAMVYGGAAGPRLLSLGGTAAIVKLWEKTPGAPSAATLWRKDFGGKFSRMRDAEVADVFGDGGATIAVATHDQGVVAVLRPRPDGSFEVIELDHEKDTFVHEIEVGDVDGDGALEVYATPSEPNRLDGSPQSGKVVRYVPKRGEGRKLVADLGQRHAKEILVADLDASGRDELYVSVEGDKGGAGGNPPAAPVEIRRYEADTKADAGVVIASFDDSLSRFLTAGDLDGDGKPELVAATFSSGVWLLRPGADPKAAWKKELIDADSAGFEHAALITDLDGDGVGELYVASDKHKEVRRYVWKNGRPVRDVIYRRGDDRPIFTWNLMPVPVELIP